jgi:hypothetical protein
MKLLTLSLFAASLIAGGNHKDRPDAHVPEPGTWAMMLIAGAGLAAWKLRKRS